MKTSVLLAAIFIAACVTKASKDDAPGAYDLQTAQGAEALVLEADGRFHHLARSPKKLILDEKGRWEWEQEAPEGSGEIISINGYTTLIPGMEGYGLWPAVIERYRGRVRLVVNRDLGLFYYKRQAH